MPLYAPSSSAGGTTAALDEPFVADNFTAAYTMDQSTTKGGLSVSGGMLSTGDALDHTWHATNVSVTDGKHVVKVVPGASPNHLVYLCAKFIDDLNLICAQGVTGSGTIDLNTIIAGVTVARTTVANPFATGADPFWIALRHQGSTYTLEAHKQDPLLGAAEPAGSSTVVLSGAAQLAFGAGVAGKPGLRLAGFNGGLLTTDCRLDDWVVVSSPSTARTAF